ncbi:MAG: hypothetical protein GMKNLPBB_01857 [Myxococcota bacterium]|nr:hypothetical protein [Myxococcota bacterium]
MNLQGGWIVLPGYNHNIKHNNEIFHVQTEDSGLKNPHVITHVFVGGNIVASKKTSYADIISEANVADLVRAIMEKQHKDVLRDLIKGSYDQNVSRLRSGLPPQQAKASVQTPAVPPPGPSKPEPAEQPAAKTAQPAPPFARPSTSPTPPPRPTTPSIPGVLPPARPASSPLPKAPARPAPAMPAPSLAMPQAVISPPNPPRPTSPAMQAVPPSGQPPVRPSTAGATITVNSQNANGFFNELSSDKSLDEIILSYLAEESAKK